MSTQILAQPTAPAFSAGYDLYLDHQPITSCQTLDQRRGWLSANKAEAEASYAAWCEAEADDYADWIDEVEWLRRGC